MNMRDTKRRAEAMLKAQATRTPSLFIGGLPVESEGAATIEVVNPTTAQPFARSPAANGRDVEHAVESARRAFEDGFGGMSPQARSQLLWRIADFLEQEAEDLAILESLQTGRTFREVLTSDVAAGVAAFRHFAGSAGQHPGETHELGNGTIGLVRFEPHPAVGLILTWTAPLQALLRKLAPIFAAGSTAVVKPPEQAPLTAIRVAELMTEAGLPAGAINVVTGLGSQAGEALALSPGISRVAFNGSIETARRILLGAAKSNLKQVDLDLGGKSPMLLFEDADLRQALGAAWKSIFTARSVQGTAASRLLVHESIYETVSTTLAQRAKEIVLGDPLDEHTELGPLISEEHMKRVLAYVELGRREGAKLIAGGKRDVEGSRSEGFFVQPTVFMDVAPAMRIAREEVRGPLLAISPFKNEEEALEIANGTDYGLAAGIWTRDLARAHRVAQRIKAGVVWVNQYGDLDASMPFGGVDLSGYGRDLGRIALDQCTRTKSIYLACR